MIRIPSSLFCLVACISLASCGGDSGSSPSLDIGSGQAPPRKGEFACTANIVPGLVVEVRDDVTDAPLAGSAVAIVADGDYQEAMRPFGYDGDPQQLYSLSAAAERPGVYAIVVTVDGYMPWRLDGVEVRAAVCHVETVRVTARLQRVTS